METSVLTAKGQIVVPARIRQRLGLVKGAKVAIIEDEAGFVVRPMNKKYFEAYAGILGTSGKLTKRLLAERRRDRKREDVRS